MAKIEGVISRNEPKEIDVSSSDTKVYVRTNITKITQTDPIFKTEEVFYKYDEIQYTVSEWCKINLNNINNTINELIAEINELTEKMNKLTNIVNSSRVDNCAINIEDIQSNIINTQK